MAKYSASRLSLKAIAIVKADSLLKEDDARSHGGSPVGVNRRRGDGTFGELVPAAEASRQEGFVVARGPVATIEVGAET